MKHNRIYLLWMALTVLALHSGQIRAQVTIGSNVTPDANSLLDLKNQSDVNASTKGLLLPRVQLTATDNFAPLTAHVMGMTVYNTATAGTAPKNVTPGYYYNDGQKWVRLADAADIKNIYTHDGTLLADRTVIQADKTLAFTSTANTGTSHFTVDGTTLNVDAVNNRVGIGTAAPKATLDVTTPSTYANGDLAGVSVPQLNGDQIEAMVTTNLKTGTIVYATAASTATTPDVNSIGFWYWKDATSKWEPFVSGTSTNEEWAYDSTGKKTYLVRTATGDEVSYSVDKNNTTKHVSTLLGAIGSATNFSSAYANLFTKSIKSEYLSADVLTKNNTVDIFFDFSRKGNLVTKNHFDNSTITLPASGISKKSYEGEYMFTETENGLAGELGYVAGRINYTSLGQNEKIGEAAVPTPLTAVNADYLIGEANGAFNRSSGTVNNMIGTRSYAYHYANTGTVNNSRSFYGYTNSYGIIGTSYGIDSENNFRDGSVTNSVYAMRAKNNALAGSTITDMRGIYVNNVVSASSTVDNLYGIHILPSVSGTLKKNYGLYISPVKGADDSNATSDDNYAIYTNEGRVRIGDEQEIIHGGNIFDATTPKPLLTLSSYGPGLVFHDRTSIGTYTGDVSMGLESGTLHFGFKHTANGETTFTDKVVIDNVKGNVGIATSTPISNLDVNGSWGTAITTLSSGTLDATHNTVIVTGDITIPSPSLVSNKGRIYTLVLGDTGSHTISGTFYWPGNASTTTHGSRTMNTTDNKLVIQSDGTRWIVLQKSVN